MKNVLPRLERKVEQESRINRRPVNKWQKRSNTIQTVMKLLDAEIAMNKLHLKVYVDTNDFEMITKSASKLERLVGDYNDFYNKHYGI